MDDHKDVTSQNIYFYIQNIYLYFYVTIRTLLKQKEIKTNRKVELLTTCRYNFINGLPDGLK